MSTPFLSARRIECERAFQRYGEIIAQNARDKSRFVSAWFGSFLARVVRVQKLAELNDFSLESMERKPTKVEEEDIIETAVNRICESQEDPSLETLRMQLGFESMYDTELRRIQSNRLRKESEKEKQIDKIVQLGLDLQTTEQVATLYRQIFRLLIANGGVETVDRLVEREIAAALESVFPQAGLNAFNVLPREEKRKQITDMISIVLGIRLFNKHIRKGGAGLADVPSVLPGALEELHRQLDGEAVQETDVSTQYANLLDLEYERPGTISGSVKRLQTEYTNRRQYVLFVHQLRHETLEAAQTVNGTIEQLNALLSQLKDVVGTKTSIPKDQVYPKFHSVAELWTALVMQDEALKVRKIVFEELLRFKNSFTRSIIPSDVALLDSWTPAAAEVKGAGAFEFVGDWKADDTSNPSDLSRLTADSFPGFLSLALQYQGYCPWALFKRQGMLLPGNPNLGILKVKSREQHFSFSSVEAMKQFCESPQRYIEGVKRTAIKYPELIHLLSLQDELSLCSIPTLLDFLNIDSSSPGPQMMINGSNKVDQDCQTPVHIVESNIDPNYQWNEWTLRKQAIQLANITNKSTHSSQTDESHFRRENDAQCYVKGILADGTMPGVGSQTGVEKGTQVEQTSRYFAGLRGHPQSKMSVINLTLDSKVTEGSNNNFPNFKGTSATVTVPSQAKQAQ